MKGTTRTFSALALRIGAPTLVALALALLLLSAAAAGAAAAELQVTSLKASGPGSLAQVISEAPEGSTIKFKVAGTITLTEEVKIEKALTIAGPGASHVIISGAGRHRIFYVQAPGLVSISGLSLSHGYSLISGGAIEAFSPLSLSACTFEADRTGGPGGTSTTALSGYGRGGAIDAGANLTVASSAFKSDSAGGAGGAGSESGAGEGGAIFAGAADVSIQASTFTADKAGGKGGSGFMSGRSGGGAIWVSAQHVTVDTSTLSADTAGGAGSSGEFSGVGGGGALYAPGPAELTLEGDSFSADKAGGIGGMGPFSGEGNGGALVLGHDSPKIVASSFSGDLAGGQGGAGEESGSGFGGAIHAYDSETAVQVSASTFASNRAGGTGSGGEFSGRGHGGALDAVAAELALRDSTLSGNHAGGTAGKGSGSGAGEGGALFSSGGSSILLLLDTIDANVGASGKHASAIQASAEVNARGTIVSGNSGAPACSLASVPVGANDLEYPAHQGCEFPEGSVIGLNPLLSALAKNGGPTLTQAISMKSPAAGAIPNATCESFEVKVDQRGLARPGTPGGPCSIGAYEIEPKV